MDKTLDFECLVIGGGIVGSFVFNNLILKGIKTGLVEATEDVANGATKANSAIIHAGYDCQPGTNKARLNVRGNALYDSIAKRLGEKIIRTGSLVVGDKTSLNKLKELFERGQKNGVKDLMLLNTIDLHKLEPNLTDEMCYGLYAKSAKIIAPYHFAVSLCEEAVVNGGQLFLSSPVTKIVKTKFGFKVYAGAFCLTTKFLINCAGAGASEINKLAGAEKITQTYTKGEYIILDKSETGLVSRPIFPLPSKKGKGILVLPTAGGNILLGPTAHDITTYETATTQEGIAEIKAQTSKMINGLNFKKAIKFYAGVRVKSGDDFILGFSKIVPNYYYTAGISSPGLASAPAIAEEIVNALLFKGLVPRKIQFKPRKPYTNTSEMSEKDLNALIAKNPKYGKIVCRCEKITEGEIEEVLNGPIRPLTIEGLKRRLRVTMGRCQGSFCTPTLINLVAKNYKTDTSEVVVRGHSRLITNNIKEGGIYEN